LPSRLFSGNSTAKYGIAVKNNIAVKDNIASLSKKEEKLQESESFLILRLVRNYNPGYNITDYANPLQRKEYP
jgi:hypothetical protein